MITVITICYNSIGFIERTIKSVLSQDYKDLEYIIIDGGSTDGTKDIINKYSDKISYWCSEPDRGIYDAMNKGIKYAKGEWINFMNSGDVFYSNTILSEIKLEEYQENIKVVYGDVIMEYNNKLCYRKAYPIDTMTFRMPFCHQSTFVRTKLLKRNMFNLKYVIGADYNLFYSIYVTYGKNVFKYIPLCLSKCDATDSLSQKNKYSLWKEYIKIRKAHKDLRWYYDSFKLIIKELLGYGKK